MLGKINKKDAINCENNSLLTGLGQTSGTRPKNGLLYNFLSDPRFGHNQYLWTLWASTDQDH